MRTATLGLTDDEYRTMYNVEPFAEIVKANGEAVSLRKTNASKVSLSKARRARLQKYGYRSAGPLPSACRLYDRVLDRLERDIYSLDPRALREEWRAVHSDQAAEFDDREIEDIKTVLKEPRKLRWGMLRHARECPRHQERVLMYLARIEQKNPTAIFGLLGIAVSTVYRMLNDVERRAPLAFRLTSGDIARRWGRHPRTVTKWAASGKLKGWHPEGRWWFFARDILSNPPLSDDP
jgi:hypothetical protein